MRLIRGPAAPGPSRRKKHVTNLYKRVRSMELTEAQRDGVQLALGLGCWPAAALLAVAVSMVACHLAVGNGP